MMKAENARILDLDDVKVALNGVDDPFGLHMGICPEACCNDIFHPVDPEVIEQGIGRNAVIGLVIPVQDAEQAVRSQGGELVLLNQCVQCLHGLMRFPVQRVNVIFLVHHGDNRGFGCQLMTKGYIFPEHFILPDGGQWTGPFFNPCHEGVCILGREPVHGVKLFPLTVDKRHGRFPGNHHGAVRKVFPHPFAHFEEILPVGCKSVIPVAPHVFGKDFLIVFDLYGGR